MVADRLAETKWLRVLNKVNSGSRDSGKRPFLFQTNLAQL